MKIGNTETSSNGQKCGERPQPGLQEISVYPILMHLGIRVSPDAQGKP